MWRNPLIIKLSLSLTAFVLLLGAIPVMADEEADWVKELKSNSPEPGLKRQTQVQETSKGGDITRQDAANDLATINDMNPTDLRSHASAHLKDGEFETAIRLVERAIELQPEDTDGRQIYADALEQKLKSQTERDPHTFNQCVKQWYFLYKNAEYPEMGNLAATHLKNLTDKSPYVWPTPKMYLGRVLMPEVIKDGTPAIVTEEPTQIH